MNDAMMDGLMIEDGVRDAVWHLMMQRRVDAVNDKSIVILLTNVPELGGAMVYGKMLYYSARPGVQAAEVVQPYIYGKRLAALLRARAYVDVTADDLDRWHDDVNRAIHSWGEWLVKQDLLDLPPNPNDIGVIPQGPGKVLLQWDPEKGGREMSTRFGNGTMQFDYLDRIWRQPSAMDLSDPARRPE